MKDSLTPNQLAKRWSCSENTIRNLVARGELEAYRVGMKLIRISSDEIRRYETCA